MDTRKVRRRIIDSSAVPSFRRSASMSYHNLSNNELRHRQRWTTSDRFGVCGDKPWDLKPTELDSNNHFMDIVIPLHLQLTQTGSGVPCDNLPVKEGYASQDRYSEHVILCDYYENPENDLDLRPRQEALFSHFNRTAPVVTQKQLSPRERINFDKVIAEINNKHGINLFRDSYKTAMDPRATQDNNFHVTHSNGEMGQKDKTVHSTRIPRPRVVPQSKTGKTQVSLVDKHSGKTACVALETIRCCSPETLICKGGPVNKDSLCFREDDSSSSLPYNRASSVRSFNSDETLVCHDSEGLFENTGRAYHNDQRGTNCLEHFYTMMQKMNKLETEDQKHKRNEFSEDETKVFKESRHSKYLKICGLELKDPHSIELELTRTGENHNYDFDAAPDLFEAIMSDFERDQLKQEELSSRQLFNEFYEEGNDEGDSDSMEVPLGTARLLSVEEKWQIIFNEKTRAPIYAVNQYIEYLTQFVNGKSVASRDTRDNIRKEGIHPISYLLRKLKLDLKMSYESFIEEFLKSENNGMTLLVKLLKSIQNSECRQTGSTNLTQLKNYKKTLTDEHDCLLCIKYSLRIKRALQTLLDVTYGLETVATSLISTYTKARGTAVEILTVALATADGFSRILDSFTYVQLKIGEPVRFKSLMNMLNMDSQQNTVFKVSTMKFLNTLLDASTNTNIRVFLQHELETAGLDIKYMTEKATGTGLEHDDLRHELSEWHRKYVNVDALLTQRGQVLPQEHVLQTETIEDLERKCQRLAEDKVKLQRQMKEMSKELRNKHEELRRRKESGCDAFTQSTPTQTQSVACQCVLPEDDPVRATARILDWKDVYTEEDAVYIPPDIHENVQLENQEDDGDGVGKVTHWLHSHCSDYDKTKSTKLAGKTNSFRRDSLARRQVRKAEFPGNWKLIPKSLEHFPSRFTSRQCHQTQCDRCDPRNRPENLIPTDGVCSHVHNPPVDVRLQDRVTSSQTPCEVKSQSSDSAIGGSGERLWNERRIPPLSADATEAEILQELIQPEDSASACPTNEPFPDYSPRHTGFQTYKSYSTELSQVLREFEGNLTKYENPVKRPSGGTMNL